MSRRTFKHFSCTRAEGKSNCCSCSLPWGESWNVGTLCRCDSDVHSSNTDRTSNKPEKFTWKHRWNVNINEYKIHLSIDLFIYLFIYFCIYLKGIFMCLFIFLQICTLFWEKDTDLADVSEIKNKKKRRMKNFQRKIIKKTYNCLITKAFLNGNDEEWYSHKPTLKL